jgi:hypothetical protein
MKVEISEESFEFLKNLVNEMKTQDRACTADPYFYVVQELVTRPAYDGCGSETRYATDWNDGLVTKDSILEDINDNSELGGKTLEELVDEGIITEYEVDEEYENTDNCNVFFTKKAYEEHIRRNGHNLCCPRPYIYHAYRNSEIENLFKAIKEIVDGCNR